MTIAKVFWSGRSQAVRLPKEYRFQTREVRIRQHGVAVILEPVEENWAWLDTVVGQIDDDFAGEARRQPSEQHRPSLDFFE